MTAAAPIATPLGTPPSDRIETTQCGRCCGTGRYSYNQVHGSRCYGCGGSGKKHTKRGAVAARYLEQLRSKPAADFKPGDLVRYDMFNAVGSARIWVTVTGVAPSSIKVIVNGQPSTSPSVTIKGTGKYGNVSMITAADRPLRQGFDAASKRRQLIDAIAYQATLTVEGKPRKDMPAHPSVDPVGILIRNAA